MTRPYETLDVNGYTVKIYTDEDAESPDGWGDDSLFLSYDCRRVAAGRKGYARNGARHPDTHHVYVLDVDDGPYTDLYLGDAVLPRDEDEEHEDEEHEGYVYVSRAEWPDEKAAREAAACLVEEWNRYLSGDVYGYVVEDDDGNEVDSCWGFYGIDAVREEGKVSAEAEVKRRDAYNASERDAGNDPRGPDTEPNDEDCAGE